MVESCFSINGAGLNASSQVHEVGLRCFGIHATRPLAIGNSGFPEQFNKFIANHT